MSYWSRMTIKKCSMFWFTYITWQVNVVIPINFFKSSTKIFNFRICKCSTDILMIYDPIFVYGRIFKPWKDMIYASLTLMCDTSKFTMAKSKIKLMKHCLVPHSFCIFFKDVKIHIAQEFNFCRALWQKNIFERWKKHHFFL